MKNKQNFDFIISTISQSIKILEKRMKNLRNLFL